MYPLEPLYVAKHGPYGRLPQKAHEDDAAYDISSAEQLTVTIPPHDWGLVSGGFRVAIPDGCVGLICPRSGLALKSGITVLNAPGVIDPGYRGEVCVVLMNLSNEQFSVCPGDRIAQLLIVPTRTFRVFEWDGVPSDFFTTERGEDGFGSTGVAA